MYEEVCQFVGEAYILDTVLLNRGMADGRPFKRGKLGHRISFP